MVAGYLLERHDPLRAGLHRLTEEFHAGVRRQLDQLTVGPPPRVAPASMLTFISVVVVTPPRQNICCKDGNSRPVKSASL